MMCLCENVSQQCKEQKKTEFTQVKKEREKTALNWARKKEKHTTGKVSFISKE